MKLQKCIDLIHSELCRTDNAITQGKKSCIKQTRTPKSVMRHEFMIDDWFRIRVLYSRRHGIMCSVAYDLMNDGTWIRPHKCKGFVKPEQLLSHLRGFRVEN